MGCFRVDDEVPLSSENFLASLYVEGKYELAKCYICYILCCRYIYTGSVNVNLDVAQDLLRAADQYLLEGLKRLCEYSIAQVSSIYEMNIFFGPYHILGLMVSSCILKDISVENVSLMFELSEAFNAMSLQHACILFILENFDKLSLMPWYGTIGLSL